MGLSNCFIPVLSNVLHGIWGHIYCQPGRFLSAVCVSHFRAHLVLGPNDYPHGQVQKKTKKPKQNNETTATTKTDRTRDNQAQLAPSGWRYPIRVYPNPTCPIYPILFLQHRFNTHWLSILWIGKPPGGVGIGPGTTRYRTPYR